MDVSSTLWEVFGRSLRTNASRPALTAGGQTLTYAELADHVAGAASQLRTAGVACGDRVVLLTRNVAGFPIYDLALMSLGAVKVPLNPLVSSSDVATVVSRVSAAVAVVSDSLRPLLSGVPSDLTVLPDVVTPGDRRELPVTPPVGGDDPAVVYFTGGTTGAPKGIVHNQRGAVANLWAHLLEADIRRDERLLLNTPVAHAAGLFVLAGLLRGAQVYLEEGFDPRRVLQQVHERSITWTFAVPTTIYRLLDQAESFDGDLSSLRTVQYGAAPISPAQLARALRLWGPVLQQLYAQTESPNYATLLRKDDHERALAEPHLLKSAGRATLMCDVAVVDSEGHPVATGDTGEVALRSPYVMHGYWGDPEGGKARFCNGWMLTGDIGYLDEEGFLYLVDRRNDMIVTGGMNVYSIEVEQALLRHPSIIAAAVVGRPHEDWGEQVTAVVTVADDYDEAAVRGHCKAELAAYKCPKEFHVVDALPLTQYGKVDKVALRKATGMSV